MTYDPHRPAFIPCDKTKSNNKEKEAVNEKSSSFDYGLLAKRTFTLSLLLAFGYLLSQIITEKVIYFVLIIAGVLIAKWLIGLVIRIGFKILSVVFWLSVIAIATMAIL